MERGYFRSNLKGTVRVFTFTLSQQLKGRMNLISLLLFFLLSAASVPVMVLTSGGGKKASASGIQKVYVENKTDYTMDFASAGERNPAFMDTRFTQAEFTLDTYESHLSEREVFAEVSASAGGYSIDTYTLEESPLEEEDIDALGQVMYQLFSEARVKRAGASAGQMELLNKTPQVQVMTVDEYRNPDSPGFETRFAVQYVYAILVLMLCLMSSSFIVQAVAVEKSSKLIDLLMVSVRPLALLAGKILAMMVYILILIGILLLGYGVSYQVSGLFLDVSVIQSQGSVFGFSLGNIQFGALDILVILISLLLGYLLFSMAAGLAGSCCLTVEDVQGANMAVVLIVLAGYLAACVVSSFDTVPVAVASSLIPVLSVFCAPVQYVLGNIGFGMILLSFAIQLTVLLLFALFIAKVYSSLLIYRGSRVKLSRLFSMMKKKGGQKA